MGLRETMQAAAVAIVAAVGNIAASTNYHAVASVATYNASSGAAGTTTYSTVHGVSVVFMEFEVEKVDGVQVLPEDKQALIAAGPLSAITPRPKDQILEVSTTWEVVRVGVDPAGAAYMLQVRTP